MVKTLDPGQGNGPGALNGGVYVVRRRTDGLKCVEKRLPPDKIRDGYLIQELIKLRALEHPNIVQYIDGFVCMRSDPPAAALYMEYCDLGSLADVIDRYRARPDRPYMPEAFIWHAFHCMLKALAYLHHGIVDVKEFAQVDNWLTVLHRDLKPQNVFVRMAESGARYPKVVLGDFGIAMREDDPEWGMADDLCGSMAWQPPEVPHHDREGRGDVWSVGAMIQSMCRLDDGPVGRPPPGISMDDWVAHPKARRPKTAGSHYSKQLNTVLTAALTLKRRHRPTAVVLLLELKELFQEVLPKWKQLPDWVFG